MDNTDIIDTLNHLVSTCRGDEQGFQRCAANASHPRMQAFFEQRAALCATAAAELQRMVAQSGGRIERADSAAAASSGASPIADTFSPSSALGLIDECERRESRTLERYLEAVEEPLPALLRMQIERQCEVVKNHCRELRQLREQTVRETAAR
ncbi:MAG: PA2169 family four-helix-bundle protein [Rubrivivax sp.]